MLNKAIITYYIYITYMGGEDGRPEYLHVQLLQPPSSPFWREGFYLFVLKIFSY